MDKIMMSSVQRGMFSIYTHESKFTENINTKVNAEKACIEGDILRDQLYGHRVLECPSIYQNRDLANSFRL